MALNAGPHFNEPARSIGVEMLSLSNADCRSIVGLASRFGHSVRHLWPLAVAILDSTA